MVIIAAGQIWGHRLRPEVLWEIVKRAAQGDGTDSWHPTTRGV